MPKNATIYLIRHGEKPPDGCAAPGVSEQALPAKGENAKPEESKDLSLQGRTRAAAYASYFRDRPLGQNQGRINYLFASADSSDSRRPRLTIEPLSVALGLPINTDYKAEEFANLAQMILPDPTYDNSNILICWHHGQILHLAHALGARRDVLPPAAHWPAPPWPADVFGWVLELVYGPDGQLSPAQTSCSNQQLMYCDYGKDPPAGS